MDRTEETREPVIINIYDMERMSPEKMFPKMLDDDKMFPEKRSQAKLQVGKNVPECKNKHMPINDYTKLLGIGVFHTGVEVYGSEYAYGGHISTFTGIYDMNPKDALILGEDFSYKKSVVIGYTQFKRTEISQLIAHLGRDFRGNSYSIVSKNCNHFTREFCLMLCGRRIPRWINRLANIIRFVPFLRNFVEMNMGIPAIVPACCEDQVNGVDSEASQDTKESTENSSSIDLKTDELAPRQRSIVSSVTAHHSPLRSSRTYDVK